MRSVIWVVLMAVGATLASATGQHLAPADFKRASAEEKRTTLHRLAESPLGSADPDITELLSAALDDTGEETRLLALSVVTGRAFAQQSSLTSHPSERAMLLALRPRLLRFLRDNNEEARLMGVRAVGNIEMERSNGKARLNRDFAQRIITIYASDPSNRVRAEIVKALALTESDANASDRRAVFLDALGSSDISTIQYAVLGAGQLHLTVALPRIAQLLAHGDRQLRIIAAQVIPQFGAVAAQYLPNLERAVIRETDEATRQTLLGAIQLIQRKGPQQ